MKNGQQGFTLGELMMSLAVMGISLSLAVPGFQTVMNNNRRASAVNQMISTMHMARSEAVTRNVQVTICPSTNGTSCENTDWNKGWLYFPDLDGDRQVDADEDVLGYVAESSHLEIDSAEFPTFFVYRPSGRVMVNVPGENSGQLTFCDKRGADYARVVTVSTNGQPHLSEYQMDGSDPACA
jgi:type IV fimbrial biogenesis protein FimT